VHGLPRGLLPGKCRILVVQLVPRWLLPIKHWENVLWEHLHSWAIFGRCGEYVFAL
jgi:hypothetical protein